MPAPSTCLAVIPARAQSSRFPLKVLAPILGKPMIQWVWEAASRIEGVDSLVVATDSQQVSDCVTGFGGEALITPEFFSGTDRVAWAAKHCPPTDFVLNLQGDEPLLRPSDIDKLIKALKSMDKNESQRAMVTLAAPWPKSLDCEDQNQVKVVLDELGWALDFAREVPRHPYLKHLGIYGFSHSVLENFCKLAPSPTEQSRRLEQWRALENGIRIKVVVVEKDTIAVDTPEDISKVEDGLRAMQ